MWKISLDDNLQAQRIIPIFINQNFILRPLAGKKIFDEILNNSSKIKVEKIIEIEKETFNRIYDISKEFAYDTFLKMKADFEKKNEEMYRKYLYALELRIEAQRI